MLNKDSQIPPINLPRSYSFNGCTLEVMEIEGKIHHRIQTPLRTHQFKRNLIELLDVLKTHDLGHDLQSLIRSEIV